MKKLDLLDKLLILVVLWFVLGGSLPSIGGAKPTAATYTYDKSVTVVPAPVQAALDKLNRRGIMATLDEVGPGEVADQYKVSRPAAIAVGLPAFVVMGGNKVIRVVKDPKTEAAALEAVP